MQKTTLLIKNIRFFSLYIIGVILLTSCHKDDPKEPEPREAQKTILMYLPCAEGLYTNFTNNIDCVEKAIINNHGLGDNRFLIFINEYDNIEKTYTEAHFIELKYNRSKIERDTIASYSLSHFNTLEGLTKIFLDVKTIAPAKDYGLIVGCHGEGWIPARGSQKKSTRYFGGNAVSYQTNVTTLSDAILANNLRMQFIMFDACYMSCIENAYDLRNATDYVIASTSEVMDYGMPYDKILPYLLTAQPSYENVINGYHEFYTNYNSPYGTLAVTDCQYLDDMAALMKQINANNVISEENLNNVQDLDGVHHTPTVYYDFGDYVDKMLIGSADESQYKAQFHEVLDNLVPYKSATNQILCTLSYWEYNYVNVENFSGLTISDPSINSVAIETKTTTNWWKATH